MTKDEAASYCEKTAVGSLIVLAALLPLALNPYGNAFFESPKMVLLRLAVMVGVLAWCLAMLLRLRFVWIKTPLDWPLAALIAGASVSTVLAINPHVSFYGQLNRFDGLLSLVCYVALFYLAVNLITSRRRLARLVAAFLGASALVSVVAVLERLGLYVLPYTTGVGGIDPTRSSSTYGNPLYLGAYLTIAIPIGLGTIAYLVAERDAAATRKEGHAPNVLTASVLAIVSVQLTALVSTNGRAAWLGAGTAFVILTLLLIMRGGFNRSLLVLFVPLLAALALYGMIQTFSTAPTAESAASRAGSIADLSQGTAFNRLYIWKMTLPALADRPLFGYGLDSYLEMFPKLRPRDWYRAVKENAIPDKPHNDLLQVAAGQGLIGLAAYLALLAAFFRSAVRAAARSRALLQRVALAALVAAAAGYLLQLQASFAVIGVAPLFWIAAGIATSLGQGRERERRRIQLSLAAGTAATPLLQASIAAGLVVAFAWGAFGLGKSLASDVYVRLGQKQAGEGHALAAVPYFEKAAAVNPYETRFPMLAGQANEEAFVRTRDSAYAEKAISYSRSAQAADPYFMEPYFREASVYRYMASSGGGPLFNAARVYETILSMDPYNQDAHFNLGITLYDLKFYAKAARTLETATDLKPDDGEAWAALGAAYAKEGRTAEARRALQSALRLDPGHGKAKEQMQALEETRTAGGSKT